MQVTENPEKEVPLKPNVKLVANMHGNEAVGRELVLHLIAHLVNNANRSSNVKNLLRHTNIFVLPSMNPDGFENSTEGNCESGGRRNAKGYDLNRNFPDRLVPNAHREQPETTALRRWMEDTQFALSANLHGGAVVVNYPFDNSRNHSDDHIAVTPDHDVFYHLSLVYAKKHTKMRSKSTQCEEESFENGITNGNAWYPVSGSMQDYAYVFAGHYELTLELSCCKFPPASTLLNYWNDNKVALLTYLTEAHKGVKGIVRDHNNDLPIVKANLTILGREVPFQTDRRGQFWRVLLPGDYVLMVKASGYRTLQKQFTVSENKITIINVYLAPTRRERNSLPDFWQPVNNTQIRESYATASHVERLTLTGGGGSVCPHCLTTSVPLWAAGLLLSVLLNGRSIAAN